MEILLNFQRSHPQVGAVGLVLQHLEQPQVQTVDLVEVVVLVPRLQLLLLDQETRQTLLHHKEMMVA
jgi:hypothetical protein